METSSVNSRHRIRRWASKATSYFSSILRKSETESGVGIEGVSAFLNQGRGPTGDGAEGTSETNVGDGGILGNEEGPEGTQIDTTTGGRQARDASNTGDTAQPKTSALLSVFRPLRNLFGAKPLASDPYRRRLLQDETNLDVLDHHAFNIGLVLNPNRSAQPVRGKKPPRYIRPDRDSYYSYLAPESYYTHDYQTTSPMSFSPTKSTTNWPYISMDYIHPTPPYSDDQRSVRSGITGMGTPFSDQFSSAPPSYDLSQQAEGDPVHTSSGRVTVTDRETLIGLLSALTSYIQSPPDDNIAAEKLVAFTNAAVSLVSGQAA